MLVTFAREVEDEIFHLSHILTDWHWDRRRSQVCDQSCQALVLPVPFPVITSLKRLQNQKEVFLGGDAGIGDLRQKGTFNATKNISEQLGQ